MRRTSPGASAACMCAARAAVRLQRIAQLQCAQRVQACLHQRLLRRNRAARQHARDGRRHARAVHATGR